MNSFAAKNPVSYWLEQHRAPAREAPQELSARLQVIREVAISRFDFREQGTCAPRRPPKPKTEDRQETENHPAPMVPQKAEKRGIRTPYNPQDIRGLAEP